jgi:hypothetical protein
MTVVAVHPLGVPRFNMNPLEFDFLQVRFPWRLPPQSKCNSSPPREYGTFNSFSGVKFLALVLILEQCAPPGSTAPFLVSRLKPIHHRKRENIKITSLVTELATGAAVLIL